MSAETGPEAFVRQLHAIMSRPDSRPLLGSIRCPTLVLVGDGDLATPPELHKEIADGIAGARLVVVPDCGHLSTIERPDAVNAALAEWLADEDETSRAFARCCCGRTMNDRRDTAGVIAPPPLLAWRARWRSA